MYGDYGLTVIETQWPSTSAVMHEDYKEYDLHVYSLLAWVQVQVYKVASNVFRSHYRWMLY